MEISIVIECDEMVSNKIQMVQDLSNKLEFYFKEKKYGEDILVIILRCICVKTIPGYEDWYKIRKPRYKETIKLKSLLPGKEDIIIKNSFCFDFKLDFEEYDSFLIGTEENCKNILKSKILEAIFNSLEKLPKKVIDFQKEHFKKDFEEFFKSYTNDIY
jgi:hypothetical protein